MPAVRYIINTSRATKLAAMLVLALAVACVITPQKGFSATIKQMAGGPIIMPNTGDNSMPIQIMVKSAPKYAFPGTCVHIEVQVTLTREIINPRVSLTSYMPIQPCRGTSHIQRDYALLCAGCKPFITGDPFWTMWNQGNEPKTGIVKAGTYNFVLNAYVPGNVIGSDCFFFGPQDTERRFAGNVSACPQYVTPLAGSGK